MRLEQFFNGYINGHLANVPNADFMSVNPYLNRCRCHVIAVDDCVQQQFTEGLFREKERFFAVDSIVADKGLHVLGVNQVHRLFDLHDERTVNFVLVKNVRVVVSKESYLYVGARNPFFWIGMEAHHGSLREIIVFKKSQVQQKNIRRHVKRFLAKTIVVKSHFPENFDRITVQVIYSHMGDRYAVPGSPLNGKNHLV